MTTTSAALAAVSSKERPARRMLVGLAVAILVLCVGMIATSHDISTDTKTADIKDFYDVSEGVSQVTAYAGMVLVGLVLFYASALRNALRTTGRTWFADAVFLGFGALAATFASWTVTDAAMWRAVDAGNDSAIRTLAIITDAGFLPLMASMIAIYVGTGLAGLATHALPKWLAIASIVVGVVAPLGPLGFIGFVVLPFWVVAVAAWVRLDA
ncbi:hypothetical protein [Aeromicrobium sp. 9AM]|uniref:hypothetical protein n=1 Tax=Aeromicrobium sp. 9AM TaxID=2653126 RepID=UPI0012EF432B|nr:hypothetical protein [Aeromicrobium sp. 9AM]VXC13497.1 membrane hypothetical protein [Aeromicrobium sp. 9AM]